VYIPGLQIDDLTDEQCRSLFRFTKADIETLCHALHIPEKIVCSNMTTVTGFDGLCILLKRFAYSCRLEDLEAIFGRSMTEIAYIIKEVLDYLHDHHCHIISDLNRNWLPPSAWRALRVQFLIEMGLYTIVGVS